MMDLFAQLRLTGDDNPFPEVGASGDLVRDTIIPTIFAITAVVCVIFIIIGGFRYVASVGNPEQTKRAKDTIMYAVIGLVVAFFATTIVSFVLGAIR